MKQTRIKEMVDLLSKELEQETIKSVSDFVYNPNIKILTDKIHDLQNRCKHEFDENNQCIYCYYFKGE